MELIGWLPRPSSRCEAESLNVLPGMTMSTACAIFRATDCGSVRTRLAVAALALGLASSASAQDLQGVFQFGSNLNDDLAALAPDGAGGSYAGGETNGTLAGPNAGSADAWLSRQDGAGNQLWARQLGTAVFDSVDAVTSDGAGGVYATGRTGLGLGGVHSGALDVWLARYDALGNQLWIRQLGSLEAEEVSFAIAGPAGGVILGGSTDGDLAGANAGGSDVWLAHFDALGNQVWLRQLGSPFNDEVTAGVTDGAGGLYVGGNTPGSFGGPHMGAQDAWIGRFDSSGNNVWLRHLGTETADALNALAEAPSGGVYVAGITLGSLGVAHGAIGGLDVWLAQYDQSGNSLWIRQVGTTGSDKVLAAAADTLGGVYLTGSTTASWAAPYVGGASDAWLGRFDSGGSFLGVQQLGTPQTEEAGAAFVSSAGVFIGGKTNGNFFGSPPGSYDPWIARFDAGCGVNAVYCTALQSSSGCLPAMDSLGNPDLSNPATFQAGAIQLEANRLGFLVFGTTGPQHSAFFGGTLCVLSPLHRLVAKSTAGTTGCSGSLSYSLADYLASPSGGPLLVAGTVVHSQAWFRDPAALQTVGLSNGLQFTICP